MKDGIKNGCREKSFSLTFSTKLLFSLNSSPVRGTLTLLLLPALFFSCSGAYQDIEDHEITLCLKSDEDTFCMDIFTFNDDKAMFLEDLGIAGMDKDSLLKYVRTGER